MNVIDMRTEDLIPYINNPRKNDEAVDYVAASIKEFGFKVPIVVDKDNVIVTGHTRLKAAKKLGMDTVPVIKADDLTESQIKAFRLADNKVSEFSSWDIDKLSIELQDIDFKMRDFGFGEFELSILTEEMIPDGYDNELLDEYSNSGEDLLQTKNVTISYTTEEESIVREKFKIVGPIKVLYMLDELKEMIGNDS